MDLNEFENLNPDEQAKILHKSPFREKGDLILHSYNPQALTRSLTSEELYLVTREMDIDERSEILRYASLPQLFFIADVDCWKKDRMDGKHFVQWLESLLAAGEEQLLLWFAHMDYEAIVSGFQHIIQVVKPDHEWAADEILGDKPYFTIDQMYYIVVHEENQDTIKRCLEILFVNLKGRYFAILEGILSELEDEVEEEAFSQRGQRLSERGFPDLETAFKIYRPITAEEFEKFPKKNRSAFAEEFHKHISNYMVLWSEEKSFLDDVLRTFVEDQTGVREQLQEELAWISNKVIACQGIDLSSEEKVRHGIDRARGLITIGLEALSGRDLQRAHDIARDHWLETVFRWGATRIFDLRDRSRHMVISRWNNSQVEFLNFVDSPYDMMFAGIFRAIPEFYDLSVKGKNPYRDIVSLDDVERLDRVVNQFQKAHDILHARFAKDFQKALRENQDREPSLSLFSFLGTCMARVALGHSPAYVPGPLKDLEAILKEGFLRRGDEWFLRPELKEKFSASLMPESKDQDLCLSLLALFYERFEAPFRNHQIGDFSNSEKFPLLCFKEISVSAAPRKPAPKGNLDA